MFGRNPQLEDFEASAKAYKKSLELEPGNAANAKSLRKAMSKLGPDASEELSSDHKQGTPDMTSMMGGGQGPDLASMMKAMGGAGGARGGGLASMLNNPEMMARAQQMMQNPAMMAQMQQMMQNPAMMQSLMGMMGGGGGNAGGPDMSALAAMMGDDGGGGGGGGAKKDKNF